jgi:SHS family sialic acid transporter-like MFS transporter
MSRTSSTIADHQLPLETAGPASASSAKWLVLLAAFLGWMFDGLEMGIFPLVARPALQSLIKSATPEQIKTWHGIIDGLFLLGAACGGLVFGWMGDRIGRVRAMSISILTYSLFTGLCYFAQTPLQIGLLRFISAIGMGGEWSLGVALVMEVWEAKRRPILAGLIGAAANVGFVSIAIVGMLFPVTQTSWRWVMLAGALPALLTFLIRLFVPESEKWRKSQEIAPSRPLRELFSGGMVGTTLLAIAFASIALIGTWGAVQKIPAWITELKNGSAPTAKAAAQICNATGAIAGCLLAPLLAAALNRRIAYFLLSAGSLLCCQILFRAFDSYGTAFLGMVFVTGVVTAAFYGWLPLYLPELFPTRVRATAQGIAFNFGRILAAAVAFRGGMLGANYAEMGAIVSLVYIAGMLLIWAAPETKGRPMPA